MIFLNCLKNISSLVENKQYDTVLRMIIAFSKHIRYVFHDNEKMVSIQSELEEVDSYYRICQLRSARPIILEKKVRKLFAAEGK